MTADHATPAELREAAKEWERSATYCDEHDWQILATRDRRIASALRYAANMIDTLGNSVILVDTDGMTKN